MHKQDLLSRRIFHLNYCQVFEGATSRFGVIYSEAQVTAVFHELDMKAAGSISTDEFFKRERWHEALLYRDLIRLARDVPLPHSLAELEWPGAPRGELERFCARIGEETLLEGIPRWEQGA